MRSEQLASRRCIRCGAEKPLAEFSRKPSRKDGIDSICKRCRVIATAEWRKRNPGRRRATDAARREAHREEVRAYERSYRERNRERLRDVQGEYRAQHREATRENHRRWRQSNGTKMLGWQRRWKAANPEKHRAHLRVREAVRAGRLVRQACEVCGSSDVHAHHDDYSRPLDVRWLCAAHHRLEHARRKQARRDPPLHAAGRAASTRRSPGAMRAREGRSETTCG